MYEVNVRSHFSSGHALRGYHGKCENPHGHNYKVRVALRGEKLDDCGMLVDFKMINSMLNRIIDELDHQNLNDLPAFAAINPSAENLASYIYHGRQSQLKEAKIQATLRNVTMCETEKNSVKYSE
jgi:6-pyruvoyltetrahydropterin/6-carboxytetrahydropterin synthase